MPMKNIMVYHCNITLPWEGEGTSCGFRRKRGGAYNLLKYVITSSHVLKSSLPSCMAVQRRLSAG